MAFRTVRISELEPISVVDETLRWHPLRHALGVNGVRRERLHRADRRARRGRGAHGGRRAGGGHEELYVVLAGRARFTIDGEELDAPAGTSCSSPIRTRAATPSRSRTARPCSRSAASRASRRGLAWEWRFRAGRTSTRGEWEQAAAILADGLRRIPATVAALRPRLLRGAARQARRAIAHLREALAADPRVREWAAEDTDLDPLRERADFPL